MKTHAFLLGVALVAVSVAAAQEPRRALRFRGRVLDVAGKPLAEAGVLFDSIERIATAEALAHPRTRTGADGAFDLSVDAARPQPWCSCLDVLLIAASGKAALWCPQFAAGAGAPTDARDNVVDLGDIRLPNGVTLGGRVRGSDGKPVAGARVRALDCLCRYPWLVPTFGGQAITTADGRFSLPGVFGTAMALTVEAEGYHDRALPVVNLGDPLDMTLEPGGFVEGTVRDADGKPWTGTILANYESADARTSVAAVDGRFRFSVPAPCRFRVIAREPSGRRAESGILAGPASGVEIRFGSAGEKFFVLRAVDAATGEPIRTFRAAALWYQEELGGSAEYSLAQAMQDSGADGKAWLDPPGLYGFAGSGKGVVGVVAPGHGPLFVERVEWRKNEEFVAKLAREAAIEGKVVDAATGKPLPAVEVSCWRGDEKLRRTRFRPHTAVLTADDGSFAIRGLASGPCELTVRRESGSVVASARVELGAGAHETVRLDMPPGVTVAGKLGGAKVDPGWMVLLASKRARSVLDPVEMAGSVDVASALAPWNCAGAVPVAADGSFRFQHRGRGTDELSLVIPMPPRQGAALRIPIKDVAIGNDDVALDVDVGKLVPGTITGRLSSEGARLPPGRLAVVSVADHPSTGFRGFDEWLRCRHWALVDDGGTFTLPAVPGVHRLEAIDIATGVVLGKSKDDGEVQSGRPTTMDLRVEVVEMTVVLETRQPQHGADRLEIYVGEPRPDHQLLDTALFGGGQHGSPGVSLRGVERQVRFFVPPGSVALSVATAAALVGGTSSWTSERVTETFDAELGKPLEATLKLQLPRELDGK